MNTNTNTPAAPYDAVLTCPHQITDERVVLRFDPKQPGHNALNQLGRRMTAAAGDAVAPAAPQDELGFQLLISAFARACAFGDAADRTKAGDELLACYRAALPAHAVAPVVDEQVPVLARAAFDDRHLGYEFPSDALRAGAYDEFAAGWRACKAAQDRYLMAAPVQDVAPITLLESVREYLKEGVENATGCEEADQDYDFANQLLVLLHTPIYVSAPPAVAKDVAPSDARADLDEVYSMLSIGHLARNLGTLRMNIENMERRSRCLSAIEGAFFTVATEPDPDEDGDEPGTECLLNWGSDPKDYVEQFRVALAKIAAPAAPQAVPTGEEIVAAFTAAGLNTDMHQMPNMLYSVRGQLAQLINGARSLLATYAQPAAQPADAQDAARYRWLCDKLGVTKLPCAIERIIEGGYIADGKPSIDAAIDAAIARTQEGAAS